MWHNFPTVLPPPDTLLNLRRIPESCDPLIGIWQPALAAAVVGPTNWTLPWLAISEWSVRPLDARAPAFGEEPRAGTKYRDVYTFPPKPGQSCWIRRFWLTLPPLRARWNCLDDPAFVLTSGWSIPWYMTANWQPAK